ncbi:uncharacterized protein LOC134237082 [Saccostrea cucullata]|uniref:uncharacterized protein LOC134237082 n=1 Tax=Saccostrea cuccullata TaxID=36930 RepID=UPI002ED5CAF6
MFICWQSNKKSKQLVDVEPEIDEFGYELEVMGDMHPYQTGSEPFNSPVSPSHLQGDFRHGDVDAETFPKHHGCPPPEYEENLPPMSPPPTYKEREETVMSEERY